MWKRLVDRLCCPVTGTPLELHVFEESTATLTEEQEALAKQLGLNEAQLPASVDAGALVAREAGLLYPILHGLPILLPFRTDAHAEFEARYATQLKDLGAELRCPNQRPEPGETFVMKSFSKEWLEYDYDGVIWEMDYEDHERRFLSEVGADATQRFEGPFLEIGCGLGLVTEMGQRNFQCEAVGVDLSFAAMRAAQQYRDNPFLHFVQASVFHLPFRDHTFGILYSHGVLHHTWSTEAAFRSAAPVVKPGGLSYIWVYGPGSQKATWLRRILYAGEAGLRPMLSRVPHPFIASAVLAPIALAYMASSTSTAA